MQQFEVWRILLPTTAESNETQLLSTPRSHTTFSCILQEDFNLSSCSCWCRPVRGYMNVDGGIGWADLRWGRIYHHPLPNRARHRKQPPRADDRSTLENKLWTCQTVARRQHRRACNLSSMEPECCSAPSHLLPAFSLPALAQMSLVRYMHGIPNVYLSFCMSAGTCVEKISAFICLTHTQTFNSLFPFALI